VWWLNAFESAEERDGLDLAYAQNEPLTAALLPLGKRKEEFRASLTTTMVEFRRDLSERALRIEGARFFVVAAAEDAFASIGAVFQATDATRLVVMPAIDRDVAADLGARMGPGATILAVRPQWSCPAAAWVEADPEFWRSAPRPR